MELKDLRTALFGFNKNDVCEYISQLNYIYEQKEAQKIKEQKDILEELNKKNEELNDYNSRLNQENTDLKRITMNYRKNLNYPTKGQANWKTKLKKFAKRPFQCLRKLKNS